MDELTNEDDLTVVEGVRPILPPPNYSIDDLLNRCESTKEKLVIPHHILICPGLYSYNPVFISRRGIQRHQKCTSPLAPVTSSRLDIEWFKRRADADTRFLYETFCSATVPAYLLSHQPPPSTPLVSRGFRGSDFAVLADVTVEAPPSGPFGYMRLFKVPKKEPNTSRLIADCREINKSFELWKSRFPMPLPTLPDILRAAKGNYVACVDATSYFYQIPVTPIFNAAISLTGRGRFKTVLFKSLPMGFCLAPSIAQRTSNILLEEVRKRLADRAIKLFAWLDDFIVIAPTLTQREKGVQMIREVAMECNVVLKEPVVDKFLGFEMRNKSVHVGPEIYDKIDKLPKASSVTVQEGLSWLGYIVYLSFAFGDIPLSFYPHSLKLLSKIAGKPLGDEICLEPNVIAEWNEWLRGIKDRSVENYTPYMPRTIYADASSRGVGIVLPLHEGAWVSSIPVKSQAPIFFKELVAAYIAVASSPAPTTLLTDNTAVKGAISKGHSMIPVANTIIKHIYMSSKLRKIGYIPSADMPADGPSRNCLPHQWEHRTTPTFASSAYLNGPIRG